MATNKHATIRNHALDKCFSNHGGKFYIEDFLNACIKEIYYFANESSKLISDFVRHNYKIIVDSFLKLITMHIYPKSTLQKDKI